jgi:hypothetical protein
LRVISAPNHSILSLWRLYFYFNTRHKVQVHVMHGPAAGTFDPRQTVC